LPLDPDAVLAWGLPRLRDLPWRHTRDPWAILVAEVMLQQTPATRVIPKWEGFLASYPTPSSCAEASLGDVLRRWQGLGYARRARNLHRTAGIVVDRHGGALPHTLDELLALPGIGPYTARALLAFAFERDVAVVDTNVARVLARTVGERLTPRAAQAVADGLVPPGDGWEWNQTMIDLGASHCRPTPVCTGCPARSTCGWRLAGHPSPDPAERSAHVSRRQAPYEGSDRQARGRVLKALVAGEIVRARPDDPIVVGLADEGLVVADERGVRLPD